MVKIYLNKKKKNKDSYKYLTYLFFTNYDKINLGDVNATINT